MPTPAISTVPTRAFAFSPSKITMTGLTDGQKIDFTFNTVFNATRYADSLGNLTFPLAKVLQSAWATEDVGDMLPFTGYVNANSKLVKSVPLEIKSGGNHILGSPFAISAIWGALQVGETEPTVETIYKFGDLPLTITQNIGDSIGDNNDVLDYDNPNFGSDFLVSKAMADDLVISTFYFKTGVTLNRTFIVETLPYCVNDVYLRWIDRYGQYRYFAFLYGESANGIKDGESFNRELLDLNATTNGLYKSQAQLIDKSGNPVMGLSVPTATYEQQKFLQSLETAIKVYRYLGDNKWVEVGCKVEPIKLDERWRQNNSVNLEITMPNLYLQSL